VFVLRVANVFSAFDIAVGRGLTQTYEKTSATAVQKSMPPEGVPCRCAWSSSKSALKERFRRESTKPGTVQHGVPGLAFRSRTKAVGIESRRTFSCNKRQAAQSDQADRKVPEGARFGN